MSEWQVPHECPQCERPYIGYACDPRKHDGRVLIEHDSTPKECLVSRWGFLEPQVVMELRRRSPEEQIRYLEDRIVELVAGRVPVEKYATSVERERDDALSVLRDLVALQEERPPAAWLDHEDRVKRRRAIFARARALVAEHPTNKERL